MILVTSKSEMASLSRRLRSEGKRVALVPTMGYFHRGHLKLMEYAKKFADTVVVSIFVNPTQFGPGEDLDKYPRDLERDMELAKEVGVDVIFHPAPQDMYPVGFQTWVTVEHLSKGLCGEKRPGHFKGVATVVLKLFNIVRPHCAVFGQKDFQQLRVIERMVEDLDLSVEIVGHPIVREHDGLAMSSRNTYLGPDERKSALCLFKALELSKRLYNQGTKDPMVYKKEIGGLVDSTPNARLDYVFIGDPMTLTEVKEVRPGTLVALAAYVGTTRLIDNTILR